ncbi:MAG: hypothetical protein FJW32_23750 [Acidobacteria bacterium]|nr:hypothetical protein [Acidobacteriota bacterium]
MPFRFSMPPRATKSSSFWQIGERGSIGLPPGWGNSAPSTQTAPPVTEAPAHTEAYLTIRWASALPVRQAMVLQQFGKHGLDDARAQALLREDPAEHVIEIAGFPTTMMTQGARRMEAELLASTEILFKGRKPLRPASVSVPEHGMHLMATLRFSRMAEIGEDGLLLVSGRTGPMEFSQKFPVREMLYEGKIAI